MPRFTRSTAFRAICLGIATGSRTMITGGVLAWHRSRAPHTSGWRTWPVLRNTWVRRTLIAASAGELIGDKLPAAGSRLEPVPLAGRLVFGAVAGAALGTQDRSARSITRAGAAGMFGAAIGAFGGYHLRRSVVETTGLPDPVVAVAEDTVAIALAASAVHSH